MVEPCFAQLRVGQDYCLADQYLAQSSMLNSTSLTKENNNTTIYWGITICQGLQRGTLCICIISFNASNIPMTSGPSVASFYRCKNSASERLSNLPKDTGCWVTAGIWTQAVDWNNSYTKPLFYSFLLCCLDILAFHFKIIILSILCQAQCWTLGSGLYTRLIYLLIFPICQSLY